jgi:hypothetical protein
MSKINLAGWCSILICILGPGAAFAGPAALTKAAAGKTAAVQISDDSLRTAARDAVAGMQKALTEVVLLVEAARAERKAETISCLVANMEQIGKHLRFAQKVEIEQLDAALQLKDPVARDVARMLAKRLEMVLELKTRATACGSGVASYLAGDAVLEFESLPSHDVEMTQFVFNPVTIENRPPAASPYQLRSR